MNMLPFTFVYPALLLVAAVVLPLVWLRRRRQPTVGHSEVSIQKNLKSFHLLGWLPTILFSGFMLAMIGSLARPVVPEEHEHRSMDTRDIVLAVDISGSMSSGNVGQPPENTSWKPPATGNGSYRPLDAAQDAVLQFVPGRQGDRVGLFFFDDQAYYAWPMTDDLKVILKHALRIHKFNGSGTNFEGPTDSDPRSGPIQAALDHWRDYGKAKSKVLIMVTDGEAPISEKRFEEMAAAMDAVGGKIYVLGIGSSWSNPESPIRKLVERVGGKCFSATDSKQMLEAFATIDQLEKSQIKVETLTTYRDIYHYFVVAAVVLLILYLGSLVLTREVA
ncbi:MAG: VWA domain-containing protein [Candidatus Obscuribacterales bacterium]|nr:VWA domain-containing protein [Candidatus Obscuribacterales bacterium]